MSLFLVSAPIAGQMCVICNPLLQAISFRSVFFPLCSSWPLLHPNLSPPSALPNWHGRPICSFGFSEEPTDWCGGGCLKSGIFPSGCKTRDLHSRLRNNIDKKHWNNKPSHHRLVQMHNVCISINRMNQYWSLKVDHYTTAERLLHDCVLTYYWITPTSIHWVAF